MKVLEKANIYANKIKEILNKEIVYKLSLLLFFTLALFLRVFRLTGVPDVLHCDEAALGYNAWCLAHYGVDRYLNNMPVYPQNFNGGQSPLYTYSVVLLLAAFGNGGIPLFLVRLPGLISSTLVVIFGTKTISRIFQSRKLTLICAFLLAVCPYYIMHGRFALDCNLMLGCSVVALYYLVKYIQSGRLSQLIICGVSFGIVLYAYALSYFVISMFLCLMALYLLYTRKITIPRIVVWAVVVCITALPIILFIICLLFDIPPIHFLGFTISPIASTRTTEIYISEFWENIWCNFKLSLTYSIYPIDAVDKFYTLYPVSIPFIIIGIFISIYQFIVSVIKRSFHFSAVYSLFFLCGLITIGFVGGIFIYRVNYFFAAYIYFLILGIWGVYHFLKSYKHAFLGVLMCCYLLWGLSFMRYYFAVYSVANTPIYTQFIYFPIAEAPIAFVETELQPEDIYCDCKGMGTDYFFYVPVSPYELNETGYPDHNEWENYHFTVDYYTPVTPGCAYIVRKQNDEFLEQFYKSEITYDSWEYEHYYVFYCR